MPLTPSDYGRFAWNALAFDPRIAGVSTARPGDRVRTRSVLRDDTGRHRPADGCNSSLWWATKNGCSGSRRGRPRGETSRTNLRGQPFIDDSLEYVFTPAPYHDLPNRAHSHRQTPRELWRVLNLALTLSLKIMSRCMRICVDRSLLLLIGSIPASPDRPAKRAARSLLPPPRWAPHVALTIDANPRRAEPRARKRTKRRVLLAAGCRRRLQVFRPRNRSAGAPLRRSTSFTRFANGEGAALGCLRPSRPPPVLPTLSQSQNLTSEHGEEHGLSGPSRVATTPPLYVSRARCSASPDDHPGAPAVSVNRSRNGSSTGPAQARPRPLTVMQSTAAPLLYTLRGPRRVLGRGEAL